MAKLLNIMAALAVTGLLIACAGAKPSAAPTSGPTVGDIISPFVRMTIVTAHEAGIGDKVARAAARVAPTEANTDLEAHSPLARVPVLVTDHGHAIHDSRVIIEYLCHAAGDKALLPDEPVKRFRAAVQLNS